MRVLIAGGNGFLGSALKEALHDGGHAVSILTRHANCREDEIHWDGRAAGEWTSTLGGFDAIVNACGYGLDHWPWTESNKRRFLSSRVEPGRALANAVAEARPRPGVFVQFSGINRYGIHGDGVADESAPAAEDFLAELTVKWEAATQALANVGVRHIVVRNAVVLDRRKGLFPLMSLPAKLFAGGRLGSGQQTVPWIHVHDHRAAVKFLLENGQASGAYNLVAPAATSNAEFMGALCEALHRPYWCHVPSAALRIALGEMSVLILAGRASQPRRLLDAGFNFAFASIHAAMRQLFGHQESVRAPVA